jgi:hypothetical protein
MKTKKSTMAQSFTSVDLICVSDENGKIVSLEHDDVTCIIYKALKASGNPDRLLALNLADKVIHRLTNWQGHQTPLSLRDVEYMIQFVLSEAGNGGASKSVDAGNKQINQYS